MARIYKTVTIFGGTGFIGRQIVRELASLGMTIKVGTRFPASAYFLKTCGAPGQIAPVYCDYSDDASIAEAVKGSDFVINCVGILYEKKKSTFSHLHATLPGKIAKSCKKQSVSRFVHLSAIGIDKATSRYALTKKEGEGAAKKAFPDVMIMRPSVVFGHDDDFFNKFARLSRFMPFLPLIGSGKCMFQPVYVCDVASAVVKAITTPDGYDNNFQGQTYDLGGPEVVSLREIYERLFSCTGRKRLLLPVPWMLAKIMGWFMLVLPKPLLTPDQVESLKSDSVCRQDSPGLSELDITPTAMGLVMKDYLSVYYSDRIKTEERVT